MKTSLNKSKYYVKPLAAAITAAISTLATAQNVQELSVTQATTKKSNDINISAETLNNIQVNDIKGIFNTMVGVSVSNSTPYSQKTYIRGVEEHAANVTIDGARQDGQLFHHAGNQMIDTSMLKSVSVELGAGSVLSGYGANIGAIKYETVDPKDVLAPEEKFGFRVSTAMDTATEYQKLNLSTYGKLTDKFSALASVNWSESGDIETPSSDPIVNKHSELKSGLIKLVYDFSDVEQLEFSAQRYDDGGHRVLSGEKPGVTSLDQALGFNGYVRDTYTINYHNASDNPLLDLSVNTYFNEKKMVRGGSIDTNTTTNTTVVTPDRDYSYKTIGLDIRNSFIVNGINWTAGIESFKSEQEVTTSALKVTTLDDGTVTSEDISVPNGPEATLVAAYIQSELNFGDVTVIPGVRYDSYSLGGVYDSSFNQLSPKLAVNWQTNDELLMKASYGRIFKGPGLPETLMISEGMTQSDDAKAETGNHVEFNIIQDLANALNVNSANVYMNVYRYTIDNSYHPTKNTTLTRGLYDLTMKGIEAGFKLRNDNLSTYVAYTYNVGYNAHASANGAPAYTTDNFYSGTQVVKIGADYQVSDSVLIGWNTHLSSKAKLDDSGISGGVVVTEKIQKAGYGVSNLWLNYQVAAISGLSVNLAVENIFDKAYQNHNSFGMAWGDADYNDDEVGRNFKLAASYQF